MKQFLRYQISGSVFVGWCVIFYISAQPGLFLDKLGYFSTGDFKPLIGLVSALPIGVLIHQVSVVIKNWCFGIFFEVLSDKPGNFNIGALGCSKNDEKAKYILERVSNLNSFYYVRFDNGFLAPLLAWIFSIAVLGVSIVDTVPVSISMLIICFLTVIYIRTIVRELNVYQDQLKALAFGSKREECFRKICCGNFVC